MTPGVRVTTASENGGDASLADGRSRNPIRPGFIEHRASAARVGLNPPMIEQVKPIVPDVDARVTNGGTSPPPAPGKFPRKLGGSHYGAASRIRPASSRERPLRDLVDR
jgi:hypothetical protein